MSDSQPFRLKIPPEIQKFLGKEASRDAKLMAARGLVPMAPNIQFTALFMLTNDSDQEVKNAAKQSLLNQPPGVVSSTLAQPMHPKILDFFAREQAENDDLIEVILLNKLTPDETFEFLAPSVNETLLTIIANNQQRLLARPSIAEALRKNEQAPQSTIDRIISFLRIHGIILEGVTPELSREEVEMIMNEDESMLLSDDAFEEDEEALRSILLAEKEVEGGDDELNVIKKISTMTVADKIKFALKGNKEVRTALIKEPNKLVATSVIKNPRIKESEVVAIAQMRSVHDDVLRIISRTTDWTKNYKIKNALVNNPKCPLPVTMNFMKHLRVNDLKALMKNKNVSSQVQKFAKELYRAKQK